MYKRENVENRLLCDSRVEIIFYNRWLEFSLHVFFYVMWFLFPFVIKQLLCLVKSLLSHCKPINNNICYVGADVGARWILHERRTFFITDTRQLQYNSGYIRSYVSNVHTLFRTLRWCTLFEITGTSYYSK